MLNCCYWEITRFLYPRYHPKHVQKKCLLNEIIWLITRKMKVKVKNWSHRYDINWPRHGHKIQKCISMMILTCNKLYLSCIWSAIHEKVKEHWSWVEKRRCLYKKTCICHIRYRSICSQMFFRIGVLNNFAIFKGKHLCWVNCLY